MKETEAEETEAAWGELRSLLTAAQEGGRVYANLYAVAGRIGDDAVSYCDRTIDPVGLAKKMGVRLSAERDTSPEEVRRAILTALSTGAGGAALVKMVEGLLWEPSTRAIKLEDSRKKIMPCSLEDWFDYWGQFDADELALELAEISLFPNPAAAVYAHIADCDRDALVTIDSPDSVESGLKSWLRWAVESLRGDADFDEVSDPEYAAYMRETASTIEAALDMPDCVEPREEGPVLGNEEA